MFLSFKGDQILYLVEQYQTTIIVGQTGCGKSTRKLSVQFRIFSVFS